MAFATANTTHHWMTDAIAAQLAFRASLSPGPSIRQLLLETAFMSGGAAVAICLGVHLTRLVHFIYFRFFCRRLPQAPRIPPVVIQEE